jgi:hypothetical protein
MSFGIVPLLARPGVAVGKHFTQMAVCREISIGSGLARTGLARTRLVWTKRNFGRGTNATGPLDLAKEEFVKKSNESRGPDLPVCAPLSS